MKPTYLSSPAHTTLLEIKATGDTWQTILTEWKQGQTTTFVDQYDMSTGDAANLRARLIHKGWTEF